MSEQHHDDAEAMVDEIICPLPVSKMEVRGSGGLARAHTPGIWHLRL